MFDLFRSRDKAVRLLLGALLVLVALSMLTYLIPSYNSGGGAGDTVVAVIGKEALGMSEVQRSIQARFRNQQLPTGMMANLVPEMVQSIITQRAMAYEAARLGFQVSDADLANTIRAVVPGLFPDGKFVGKDTYAAMLAQQNLSIPEFEADLARGILVNRLRSVVAQGIVVTPAEVEDAYKRRNEKVKIEYVKLTADKVRADVQTTPEELRAYYSSHIALYQVPEKRNLAVLVLDQAKLEQSITPTDADLQKLYNQNKEQFRVPDRVKVRHILLKTTGKPDEDAAVKAKAEALLKQIKAGGNFAELAKKNSEDPGSAAKGGELPDWVTKGQMVPEFEKAAFSLPVGQTSDLVKTQYGYHIVQVLAREQAHLQTFDEVKAQLASEWKKQNANARLQQVVNGAQAALKADPQHPEKVAEQFGMQLVRAEKVAPGDPLPEIGTNREFDDSVSSLKKGDVSEPVALPANKVAMATVTDVFPAHQATFEEVQDTVKAAVVREKSEQLLAQRANELYQKATSMGGDLAKAAAAMKLDAKTSDNFDRQGAVEGLGPATYVLDAFNKPAGSLMGPLAMPDGRLVYKVLAHVPADMSGLAAQRASVREELRSAKERRRDALFEDSLRQSLTKEGKIKIHQDVVNRIISSYRG